MYHTFLVHFTKPDIEMENWFRLFPMCSPVCWTNICHSYNSLPLPASPPLVIIRKALKNSEILDFTLPPTLFETTETITFLLTSVWGHAEYFNCS